MLNGRSCKFNMVLGYVKKLGVCNIIRIFVEREPLMEPANNTRGD